MKHKLIFAAILLFGLFSIVSADFDFFTDYGSSSLRSISLRQGWNLETIYTVKEIRSIAFDLQKPPEDISAVFMYDRYEGEYFRLYPEPEREKFQKFLNSVGDPDKGGDVGEFGALVNASAWIYSEKDQRIEYPSISVSHKSVNIRPGWNFLSVTPEYIGKTLNELKGSCDFTKMYSYSPDGGGTRWVDMLNDTNFFNDETFDESAVGAGFIVKVTNNCKMGSAEASIPAVPPLPN